jgi:hypothetical protein
MAGSRGSFERGGEVMVTEPTDEHREWFRQQIDRTIGGDEVAEEMLRVVMTGIAKNAPRHALIKISQFFAGEIWMDAHREGLQEN